MTTHERYYYIQSKITKARNTHNTKALKQWKVKLEEWQLDYGAYQPVTNTNYKYFE